MISIACTHLALFAEPQGYGTWFEEKVGDQLDSLQILSLVGNVDRQSNEAS